MFYILSKCICPLPLAGGVCWCIYWQRLHFLHVGGLHALACTCVCLPFPLCTHSVCLCKGCCSCCSRQWLQGPHPRSVSQTGIGVIRSSYFFFFSLCYFYISFIWCARQPPLLSPVLQSCGQAFPARQAASHTGKQTGRASKLYSQHPHPRTFKLLKPAHHSAASLPQLLFISLENVML